jgi:hypothetical protein
MEFKLDVVYADVFGGARVGALPVIYQLMRQHALNRIPRHHEKEWLHDVYVGFAASDLNMRLTTGSVDVANTCVKAHIQSVFRRADCPYAVNFEQATDFQRYGQTMQYFGFFALDRNWRMKDKGFRTTVTECLEDIDTDTEPEMDTEILNAPQTSPLDTEQVSVMPMDTCVSNNSQRVTEIPCVQHIMSLFPYNPRLLRCHPLATLLVDQTLLKHTKSQTAHQPISADF